MENAIILSFCGEIDSQSLINDTIMKIKKKYEEQELYKEIPSLIILNWNLT